MSPGTQVQKCVLVLLVCFFQNLPTVWAERALAREGSRVTLRDTAKDKSYPVTILVIRHGLSCANVVQKWLSKADFGRGSIMDPALAGAGQLGSEEAGLKVAEWLAHPQRQYSIDATLSSPLARAVETSLLAFGAKHPVQVVPFIREVGSSSVSNTPFENHTDQIQQLHQILKGMDISDSFQVDYHFADGVGQLQPGDWNQFLQFLANVYIPDLLLRSYRRPGRRLVLAVTTHSKFLAKALGEACNLKQKLPNNAVLHLEYVFSEKQLVSGMSAGYSLEPDITQPCEVIHEGQRLTDEEGNMKEMCTADIGDACMESIYRHAILNWKLPGITVENEIWTLSKKIATLEVDISSLQQIFSNLLNEIKLRNTGMNAVPRELIARAKQLLTDLERKHDECETIFPRAQSLKHGACWTGGKPDVQAYVSKWQSKDVDAATALFWQEPHPKLPLRLRDIPTTDELKHAIIHGNMPGEKCFVVHNSQMRWLRRKEYRDIESTCFSPLRCYKADGSKPQSGETGICAVPRKKTCKKYPQGCRPRTTCVETSGTMLCLDANAD